MIGHRVVAIPSKVSTLVRGDAAGASSGGTGNRPPALGAVDNGGVPNDNAVITS